MTNGTRIPHSLRLTLFLLRLTLGLNFFYLGFGTIFNASPEKQLAERSLSGLYAWLGTPGNAGSLSLLLPYAFLVIGACLLLGLFTRTMAIAGMALTLINYVPSITYATLSVSQFMNDEVLVIVCLFVLVFANAGTYLGVDKFIHFHFASSHKK